MLQISQCQSWIVPAMNGYLGTDPCVPQIVVLAPETWHVKPWMMLKRGQGAGRDSRRRCFQIGKALFARDRAIERCQRPDFCLGI